MSEKLWQLPAFTLKDDSLCNGCRFVTQDVHKYCKCILLDKWLYVALREDITIIGRDPNCPLIPAKPQPRCGDCVKYRDYTSPTQCIFAARYNREDWHCADFERKEQIK